MSHEIQTYSKLDDLPSIQALGQSIALSGMFGCDKPEQGVIIALQCVAENKPPLEMAKNYHIIKGKLTKRADSMLADFRKAGGKWQWIDLKNPSVQKALVTFEDYDKLEVEYTVDDAKSAGVYNTSKDSPWQKTPAAMLRARCVSETLRAIAPEIVTGVYTPEEAMQFDEPVRSTAKAAPVADKPKVESKPKPQAKPEPKIVEAVTLDSLIAPHEKEVNAYFDKKGAISAEMGQTWQDLDDDTKNALLADWEAFEAAVLKGGAK